MKSESSAGMLWVGEDDDGTRYRLQLIGRIGDQRLLAQKRAPDGRSGWLECEPTKLPRAAQTFLVALGRLCDHATAAPINPACEMREDVGENEITAPTFDVSAIYLPGAT